MGQAASGTWRAHRVVGVFGGRWLLLERAGELVLLDRVAVAEMLLLQTIAEGDSSFTLIAPVRVAVGESRVAKWTDAAEVLARWGFIAERFGPRELAILAVPGVATAVDVGELVREIPLEASEIPSFLARKCARAGETFTPFEARALLLELDERGASPNGPPKLAVSLDPASLFRAG